MAELRFVNYISIDGAEPVLMETLTSEQIEYCAEKMSKRLSEAMSDYYSNHMNEYAKL